MEGIEKPYMSEYVNPENDTNGITLMIGAFEGMIGQLKSMVSNLHRMQQDMSLKEKAIAAIQESHKSKDTIIQLLEKENYLLHQQIFYMEGGQKEKSSSKSESKKKNSA